MTTIYKDDNYLEVAKKIFYDFEINQSCDIEGMMISDDEEFVPKGKMVCQQLEFLDEHENIETRQSRKRRRGVRLKNSIGGYIAHKIFVFKESQVDGKVNYTIWRVQ